LSANLRPPPPPSFFRPRPNRGIAIIFARTNLFFWVSFRPFEFSPGRVDPFCPVQRCWIFFFFSFFYRISPSPCHPMSGFPPFVNDSLFGRLKCISFSSTDCAWSSAASSPLLFVQASRVLCRCPICQVLQRFLALIFLGPPYFFFFLAALLSPYVMPEKLGIFRTVGFVFSICYCLELISQRRYSVLLIPKLFFHFFLPALLR